ncbi:MAG: DUF2065 domain-containing protein [Burkholderiales bacterium PBB4]|nr:MAG: DUF2065 domain-containing protein [Burkholderiales bacterium PBB4]
MTEDTFWLALALVLVVEGLLPLIAPATWRRMFTQLLLLNDGQIRSYAIGSILLGLLGIWWLAP